MSTTTQKHIDKDIVKQAAILLMGRNTKTTSLEVKEYLRSEGYWAKQDKVSSLLQELQTEENWGKHDGGGHLVYSPGPASSSSSSVNTTKKASQKMLDEIMHLIADSTNIDVDDIEAKSILTVDLGLDHLDLIQIQIAIDNKYGVQSTTLKWVDINTVGELAVEVEGLVNPNGSTSSTTSTNTNSTTSNTTSSNTASKKITPRKPATVINDSVNPSTNPRVTVNIDYKKIVTGKKDATDTCDAKDWYVSNKGNDPLIFDQKYTSDNVRTVYARLKGIKIQEVRASRVEHL